MSTMGDGLPERELDGQAGQVPDLIRRSSACFRVKRCRGGVNLAIGPVSPSGSAGSRGVCGDSLPYGLLSYRSRCRLFRSSLAGKAGTISFTGKLAAISWARVQLLKHWVSGAVNVRPVHKSGLETEASNQMSGAHRPWEGTPASWVDGTSPLRFVGIWVT